MDKDKELELLRKWKNEFIKALCKYDCSSIYELRHKAYDKGRADAEKDDLIIACINQLNESDADEIKVSCDTKDGYKITVIVELKEQTE